TLRPSWRGSRGGCVSFRDLALWRLRLKRGLPVRGYRRLRLRKCRRGSQLCLDLASEAEKSLGRDDERSRVGRGVGARVWGKCFSLGRPLVPVGRSGRVGSRRDPSDGQVSLVVDFAIPLLRRGARAFIATVTGYPYLNPLSSLLLTIPLHLTTPSVVLAARRAPATEGCRPCPPYLC
ncbi:hypothetical protein BHE74_00054995, partial [Ensete ventricosum]